MTAREQIETTLHRYSAGFDNDDHAQARSYSTLVVTGAQGAGIGSAGTYTDELVGAVDEWLIAKRRSRGDARS
jgi:hypothetical protein